MYKTKKILAGVICVLAIAAAIPAAFAQEESSQMPERPELSFEEMQEKTLTRIDNHLERLNEQIADLTAHREEVARATSVEELQEIFEQGRQEKFEEQKAHMLEMLNEKLANIQNNTELDDEKKAEIIERIQEHIEEVSQATSFKDLKGKMGKRGKGLKKELKKGDRPEHPDRPDKEGDGNGRSNGLGQFFGQ